MINPKLANPQIYLVFRSANLKGKRQRAVILIQIRIGLPLILYFYLRKYVLDYEMPFNTISKRSQNIMYLRIFGSFDRKK
jgi:hypothetical protein